MKAIKYFAVLTVVVLLAAVIASCGAENILTGENILGEWTAPVTLTKEMIEELLASELTDVLSNSEYSEYAQYSDDIIEAVHGLDIADLQLEPKLFFDENGRLTISLTEDGDTALDAWLNDAISRTLKKALPEIYEKQTGSSGDDLEALLSLMGMNLDDLVSQTSDKMTGQIEEYIDESLDGLRYKVEDGKLFVAEKGSGFVGLITEFVKGKLKLIGFDTKYPDAAQTAVEKLFPAEMTKSK